MEYRLKDGTAVTCKITGAIISDARITVVGGKVFICQDKAGTHRSIDQKGYKYSWMIFARTIAEGTGVISNKELESVQVYDFKVVGASGGLDFDKLLSPVKIKLNQNK